MKHYSTSNEFGHRIGGLADEIDKLLLVGHTIAEMMDSLREKFSTIKPQRILTHIYWSRMQKNVIVKCKTESGEPFYQLQREVSK